MKVIEDKISVIVPVWNAERYLYRCVDSIINQTYKNLEIILVDDGSTDRSYELCKEYALKDKRVITCHKENGGQWSARNMGLDIATGSYIGFVDNDDWILPRMYEVLIELIKKYDADVSRCSDFENKIDEDNSTFEIIKYEKPEFEELLITDTFGSHVTDRLFKRNLIGEHRFQFSCSIEDMIFMRTILPSINQEVMTTEKLFVYSNRPDNTSNLMAKTHINAYERAIEFQERFYYAMHNCPNACDILLTKAVMQGAGSLRIMWNNRSELINETKNIVEFFRKYSKTIFSNKRIPIKYKSFVLFLKFLRLNNI